MFEKLSNKLPNIWATQAWIMPLLSVVGWHVICGLMLPRIYHIESTYSVANGRSHRSEFVCKMVIWLFTAWLHRSPQKCNFATSNFCFQSTRATKECHRAFFFSINILLALIKWLLLKGFGNLVCCFFQQCPIFTWKIKIETLWYCSNG